MTNENSADQPYQRQIKSFVQRAGRLTKAQERALHELKAQYSLPSEGPLDWAEIFGNDHDVTLEIGFGMGHALAALASAHPQRNFVGIEVHPPGVGRLLNEIHQHNLTNVRILQTDGVQVLKTQIKDASLAQVLLFFPDPWHKSRHHKRRIVNEAFVTLVADKLQAGGVFHLATDWEPYSEWMLEKLAHEPRLVNMAEDGRFIPRPPSRPITKFERRGENLGHQIRDLLFQKMPS